MDLRKSRLNFIYVLTKEDEPFYIGKTHYPDRREREHKQTYGSDITLNILATIKDEDWIKHEQKWIKIFKKWGINLSNSNSGGGGPIKGIKRSKDFGKKISQSKKGVKRNKKDLISATIAKQKPVLQFDKDGNFIKEYPSAKIAAKEIGIHHNNFYDHLKGKYKTARGYIFKYK